MRKLRCPFCATSIQASAAGFHCRTCRHTFPYEAPRPLGWLSQAAKCVAHAPGKLAARIGIAGECQRFLTVHRTWPHVRLTAARDMDRYWREAGKSGFKSRWNELQRPPSRPSSGAATVLSLAKGNCVLPRRYLVMCGLI